ncbi:hypothetical protein [Halochromatium glycolicum]|nr:hypothetical protein [Halochromatium glycolicum]
MRLLSVMHDPVMQGSRHPLAWGGEPMERRLRRSVETIGWAMLALIGLVL